MKKNTHPKNNIVTVTCDCGAQYEVETTLDNFVRIEICEKCHPFFTGEGKTLDTAGRVDKFKKKMDAAKALSEKK